MWPSDCANAARALIVYCGVQLEPESSSNNFDFQPPRNTMFFSKRFISINACIFALISLTFYLIYMDKRASESYGIGISLAANHGTISVRCNDGSFKDLGRVDGDGKYLELMRRLSSPSSQHPSYVYSSCVNDQLWLTPYSPPFNDIEDLWNDWPRQTWRSTLKMVGLPASSDVATLSSMVKKLMKLAAPSSHGSPPSVVISYPALPGLYQEDITDIGTYLSLPVVDGAHRYPPREAIAAYAGHGMGLCESFTNKEKCTLEGRELPVHEILLVEYTEAAMLLHSHVIREAMDLTGSYPRVVASFELGSKVTVGPEKLLLIRDLVMKFLRKEYPYRPTEPGESIKVIMTGNAGSVSNIEVQKAIENAVIELGWTADMTTSLPEYVAARGAAELAWRAFTLSIHGELKATP